MSESKLFKTVVLLVRLWGSEFRCRQERLDPVGLTSGGRGVAGHAGAGPSPGRERSPWGGGLQVAAASSPTPCGCTWTGPTTSS